MFEGLYNRALKGVEKEGCGAVSLEMKPLLRSFCDEMTRRPVDTGRLLGAVISILEFLASTDGRTKGNCWLADLFISLPDGYELEWPELPERLRNIIEDMGGALHDAIDDPDIAHKFESLPEDLLARAQAFKRDIVVDPKRAAPKIFLVSSAAKLQGYVVQVFIGALIVGGIYCYGLFSGTTFASRRKYDWYVVNKATSPGQFASQMHLWAFLTIFLLICGTLLSNKVIASRLVQLSDRFQRSSANTKTPPWWGYAILAAVIILVIWFICLIISGKASRFMT